MIREPINSPWGEVDHCRMICPGVFNVSTPSHGGIMVELCIADGVLSKEAQKCGFAENGYLCFEEDCDAAVAIREFLKQGIIKAPVDDHWKEGEYAKTIDRSIQCWNPDYWKYCEKAEQMNKEPSKPMKKNRDREER